MASLISATLATAITLTMNPVQPPAHSQATLAADHLAATPGQTVLLAVTISIEPGWHIYWRNPGDSGMPPRLRWTLPTGFNAAPPVFPNPKIITSPGSVTFGYEDAATLIVPLQIPADAKPGPARLQLRADWLVCKESCVPQNADLTLELQIAQNPKPSPRHDSIAQAYAQRPRKLPQGVATAWTTPQGATLVLPDPPAGTKQATFFPLDEATFDYQNLQAVITNQAARFDLKKSPFASEAIKLVRGLVVYTIDLDNSVRKTSVEVEVAIP